MPCRIQFDGLRLGQIHVPAFHVDSGECVAIRWPGLAWTREEREFFQIVTGVREHGATHFGGARAVEARLDPRWSSRLVRIFWRESLRSAVRRQFGLSDESIHSILEQFNLSGSDQLERVSWNTRKLIAIASAAEIAPFVAFETVGLSPSNIRAIGALLANKLNEGRGALHVCHHPVDVNGEIRHDRIVEARWLGGPLPPSRHAADRSAAATASTAGTAARDNTV